MSSKTLKTYLNDHLAGSVAALELLDHLANLHPDPEGKRFFTRLRAEVEEDQRVLQQLLEKVGGKESTVRKAAAWLTEKIGQAKLGLDDLGDGQLRPLEAIEALGLGIQGKLALWRALAAVADRVPQLQGVDLVRLEQRAVQQHERVEARRLQTARVALTAEP
jgi:rubrerythrin